MKKLTVIFITLFLLAVSATDIFAGKRIDYGWSSDMYKYDIISGEVNSIDLEKKMLKLDDSPAYITSDTEFYNGNIETDMESVYGGMKFSEKDKLTASDIKNGKLMKCRFSRDENGVIFLDKCLLEQ